MSAPVTRNIGKTRRILSLYLPHMAAEQFLRQEARLMEHPLAVVTECGNRQVISALSPKAQAAGLFRGQALSAALALCSDLVIRNRNPAQEHAFHKALCRWAEKFSPWVAPEDTDGLVMDISGCAHLFGGEANMAKAMLCELSDLGLSAEIGLADTRGAAWALARFGAATHQTHEARGDAISQEARATRVRAALRRRDLGAKSTPPQHKRDRIPICIAPPFETQKAIWPLPVAALRLSEDILEGLARLGLHQIHDLAAQPRAGLARRFGPHLLHRLDQALGAVAEPVSPARSQLYFATRMSFPDPIGTSDDLDAAILRLIEALCQKLDKAGRSLRDLRLDLMDMTHQQRQITLRLARSHTDSPTIYNLLKLQMRHSLTDLEPTTAFDMIRLEALHTEARHETNHQNGDTTARAHEARSGLEHLITRLGTRIGIEAITRPYPADSHLAEKSEKRLAAAWSEPFDGPWPRHHLPRPLTLFPPEFIGSAAPHRPPAHFTWRRQNFTLQSALGPERIAPEWWLDDPNWRTGLRDYWCITTAQGARLWLFYAYGGAITGGWFAQGDFA
ncbi:DNA polymerase Y family protein [Rhodobacteraceae bacterium XHP0102]|nr:DNA polymerase Y family protein [Rhodobacteraceae bacterium XHP0102]